ncbi:MAG: hypothetical protein OEZ43_09900 [Gammaproteobacteria bacterium]|nr:hypothetical protein [Gammaproteobacteria bacterium]
MKIDGKNINRVNQSGNMSSPKSVSEPSTGKSESGNNVQLSNASQFALHQSGMNQQLRRANDTITNLQSRKELLRTVSDTLKQLGGQATDEQVSEMRATLSGLLTQHPEFASNGTYQNLRRLLAEEAGSTAFSESLSLSTQNIHNESVKLGKEIDNQLIGIIGEQKENRIDDVVSRLQANLGDNPSALLNAHGQISGSNAYGLLGEAQTAN